MSQQSLSCSCVNTPCHQTKCRQLALVIGHVHAVIVQPPLRSSSSMCQAPQVGSVKEGRIPRTSNGDVVTSRASKETEQLL
eukprot:5862332-Amphidinium_carterae.1